MVAGLITGAGCMLNKVLVIDDSALIHQMYRMVLKRYHCEIIDALNGQDGLNSLASNPDVNLILLDINMPLMSGLDFIGKVKASKSFDRIPIIIVSTDGMEEDTRKGLDLGALGYVKKPFLPSDLHRLIEKV